MVAGRDPVFFDIAAIGMNGYVLSHENAFIAWAQLEVGAGAHFPALLELSTGDELDSGFKREITINWLFGEFLRQANICLPAPIVAFTNYLIRVARQIASGEIDAFSAVQTLRETHAAMAWWARISCCGASPGFDFDTDRFNMLASGIMPGTFEPLGRSPAIAERIRTESAGFVEHNAALEISSDDPEDWPTRWRQR